LESFVNRMMHPLTTSSVSPTLMICTHPVQVVAALKKLVVQAPPTTAGHAVWAAAAFLPAAAKPDALKQLAAVVVEQLKPSRASPDACAVAIVHAASRLLRLHPSLLADSASRLVDFTMELLASDACAEAAHTHNVFDTVQVSLKGQV
jgi:hypothetical protein